MSGTLGFNEFKELWAVVNGWKQHFISFDNDRSGTVDRQELEKALMNMGKLWKVFASDTDLQHFPSSHSNWHTFPIKNVLDSVNLPAFSI